MIIDCNNHYENFQHLNFIFSQNSFQQQLKDFDDETNPTEWSIQSYDVSHPHLVAALI
jgi:hypothetical protein